jgi:hypothetical protein
MWRHVLYGHVGKKQWGEQDCWVYGFWREVESGSARTRYMEE